MKYKTLNITEETHNKLREYCNKEGIIMQHFADKILREYLRQKNDKLEYGRTSK